MSANSSYRDLEKFKDRSHRFVMFGLIPAGVTLYLALEIALSFTVGSGIVFGLAAIPFFTLCTYFSRRENTYLFIPGKQQSYLQ